MVDTIDRQAAICALNDVFTITGKANAVIVQDYIHRVNNRLHDLPPAQPDITDAQAIDHLQSTGWMQNHDHEMYMMGIRDGLADDSDSYDSLIQPEQAMGKWISQKGGSYKCSECGGYALNEIDGNYILVAARTPYCPFCGKRMEEWDE